MRKIEERYREALATIPAPGGGGCHAALLGVASLGIMAGRDDNTMLAEIRASIPAGRRKVPDTEIKDAIQRAHKDTAPMDQNNPRPRPIPPPRRTPAEHLAEALRDTEQAAALQASMMEAGGGSLDPEGADVWEASPVRIEARSEQFPFSGDMLPILEHLYRPDDVLFIGSRYDSGADHVKTAADWLAFFRRALAWIEKQPFQQRQGHLARLGDEYPHIIPNTLTGRAEATRSGDRQTMRGDSCVKSFRYIVAEFDALPMEKQGAVLRGLCKLELCKIAALIHSGGKSCHAWITCDGIDNGDDWARIVKEKVFPVLTVLGVDRACSNPARLSRLPGVFRSDKANWQKLLYLAPGGGEL